MYCRDRVFHSTKHIVQVVDEDDAEIRDTISEASYANEKLVALPWRGSPSFALKICTKYFNTPQVGSRSVRCEMKTSSGAAVF